MLVEKPNAVQGCSCALTPGVEGRAVAALLVDRIIEWIVALTLPAGRSTRGAAPLTRNGSPRSLLLVKTRLKFS